MFIDVVAVVGSDAASFAPIGLVAMAIAWLLGGTVFAPPARRHSCHAANPSVRAHRQCWGR
ncbi:MAG: hypothetical protein M3R24_14270 [Chloroflexota bacterium]|nr:hypothetical protein [Chloroflexota bacterium]